MFSGWRRGLAFKNHAQYRPKPKKQHQKHNGYEGKGIYEISKIVRKGFDNRWLRPRVQAQCPMK